MPIKIALLAATLLSALLAGCASPGAPRAAADNGYGVLVMAHGGPRQWNESVLAAAGSLKDKYRVEVAFGMADAASLQESVRKLEAQGARRIGVVRLFVSGESWYERTEQILGVAAGAPSRPAQAGHHAHGAHGGHSMEFWRLDSQAAYALSKQGLAESPLMDEVLADRARALSQRPALEDVLILAHGPGDDAENARWIAYLEARTEALRRALSFRRVQVETLREDWPEKRKTAEARIREYVRQAADTGGRAIVIPFRVQGFGPYARVLQGLQYVSDGQGLLPHANVAKWMQDQAAALSEGPFKAAAP
jgi:sirohydrochlorin ferrochelatase